jgi:hypothetical protein
VITPAQVQHLYSAHLLALHRYANAPAICDRHMCSFLDVWGGGGAVFLAAAPRTDFAVVVFRTPSDAARAAALYRPGTPLAADRRSNALLLYLRSASARLAIVRRIFRS